MSKLLKFSAIFFILIFALSGCKRDKEPANQVRVGTIGGPETELMQVARQVALKRFGLHVKIIQLNNYALPNAALADGDLDVNAFQTTPYLNAAVKAKGYKFAIIGNTFLYPVAIYSDKIKSLSDLKNGAIVALPNDPSNEARALLLLEKAGLIQLKPGVGSSATLQDVVQNPKQLKFKPLQAAQIPRALPDVDIAVINTNYALPAGLLPKLDGLFLESAKDNPYMNIFVARAQDKNNPKLKELIEAYQSKPVLKEANKLFKGQAIPGWK